MKSISFTIVVLCFAFVAAFGQDSPYQKAMKKEIAKVIETDSLNELQQSANAFARISELNPKEWLPVYYNALAYTFQGFNKNLSLDKKDEALAKASELVKKAGTLSAGNAEIVTLEGFILMAKLSADPANRGQSMSGQVLAAYGMALGIDGKNPRALAALAQMEFGMAQFFGSGTEKACGLAKQSAAIYAAQDEQALKAAMLPTWGRSMANGLIKSCK